MPTPSCKLPDPIVLYKNAGDEKIPAYILEAGDFLASGDVKLCLDRLNHAPVKDVKSPWGWIIAATAHSQLGNHKMAIDVSMRGLRHAGENTHLLDCLGVAHAGSEDLAAAGTCFQKAVKVDSHNINGILNLINVLLSMGDADAAFTVSAQGLKNNPGNAEIRQLYVPLHPAWLQPLETENVRIRVREPKDDSFVGACYANQAFMNNYNRYLSGSFRRSRVSKGAQAGNRLVVYKNKCIQWVVERIDSTDSGDLIYTPVGLASLADIQLTHRRAEILIGFPAADFNGGKLRVSAMLMIMNFAFNTIGFNKLTSIVYSDNAHAQKSTLALGFSQEGYFKNHLFDPNSNSWLSTYQNAMLLDDFLNNNKLARYADKFLGSRWTEKQVSVWGMS